MSGGGSRCYTHSILLRRCLVELASLPSHLFPGRPQAIPTSLNTTQRLSRPPPAPPGSLSSLTLLCFLPPEVEHTFLDPNRERQHHNSTGDPATRILEFHIPHLTLCGWI